MQIQSTQSFKCLHIMPGYLCNLQCSHCANSSGPRETVSLSQSEITLIIDEMKKHPPGKLLFTGGEPTLHIKTINEIIRGHPNLESTQIMITSNGWFTKNASSIESVLSQFEKMNHIQLSFDIFHGSRLTPENVNNLFVYCETRGISFNISIAITEPMELVKAMPFIQAEGINPKITFQKVDASGRARVNKVEYKYLSFEDTALDSGCPNWGTITYFPGKGFSVCCSNLAFNHPSLNIYAPTLDDLFKSDFYSAIKKMKVKELLTKLNYTDPKTIPANFSSPCKVCEEFHTRCL